MPPIRARIWHFGRIGLFHSDQGQQSKHACFHYRCFQSSIRSSDTSVGSTTTAFNQAYKAALQASEGTLSRPQCTDCGLKLFEVVQIQCDCHGPRRMLSIQHLLICCRCLVKVIAAIYGVRGHDEYFEARFVLGRSWAATVVHLLQLRQWPIQHLLLLCRCPVGLLGAAVGRHRARLDQQRRRDRERRRRHR